MFNFCHKLIQKPEKATERICEFVWKSEFDRIYKKRKIMTNCGNSTWNWHLTTQPLPKFCFLFLWHGMNLQVTNI